MANKKVQKFAWLLLAILALSNGSMTLTVYKQGTWSILSGSMQIIGGIILLIVLYMVFKKNENDKSF